MKSIPSNIFSTEWIVSGFHMFLKTHNIRDPCKVFKQIEIFFSTQIYSIVNLLLRFTAKTLISQFMTVGRLINSRIDMPAELFQPSFCKTLREPSSFCSEKRVLSTLIPMVLWLGLVIGFLGKSIYLKCALQFCSTLLIIIRKTLKGIVNVLLLMFYK